MKELAVILLALALVAAVVFFAFTSIEISQKESLAFNAMKAEVERLFVNHQEYVFSYSDSTITTLSTGIAEINCTISVNGLGGNHVDDSAIFARVSGEGANQKVQIVRTPGFVLGFGEENRVISIRPSSYSVQSVGTETPHGNTHVTEMSIPEDISQLPSTRSYYTNTEPTSKVTYSRDSYSSPSSGSISDNLQASLVEYAKKKISTHLKSPSTAVYPLYSKWDIQKGKDNVYNLVGYVDSQNGYGATVRETVGAMISFDGTYSSVVMLQIGDDMYFN